MTPERTELEWAYDPADLFEAPYRYVEVDFELLIDAGRAVATLKSPQEPASSEMDGHIRATIQNIFLVRQLQTHRKYNIEGPRIYQYSEGRKNISIRVESAMMAFAGFQADLVVTDAGGKVVHDSKAERIAEHRSILDSVAPKISGSPTLRSMLESYSRSITDPSNELVHLYEVRDALAKHYGSEPYARDALGISKGEWGRLGILANVEPLEQGRHRGEHVAGCRAATEIELNEARQIVRRWIILFAEAV